MQVTGFSYFKPLLMTIHQHIYSGNVKTWSLVFGRWEYLCNTKQVKQIEVIVLLHKEGSVFVLYICIDRMKYHKDG